jgi:ribosomal protein S18 acetylase RimI-like enzyme
VLCRLSFAQQRLWFLDQLHPGNSAYNVYRAVRILGPLDRDALRHSLDELVRRHEPLRTTVRLADGIPYQVVAPAAAVPLRVVDLADCPEGERAAVVLRRANEEAHRAFDLSADLLLRTTLPHLGAREHVLLLTTHHLAADGWSVGILFSELSALYEAFAAGAPSPLPELPVRYVDFAEWQRQSADGPALRPHLEYWRRQLAGAPALELPTDRPRPTRQSLENFRGARHYFLMPRPLLDAVTALARNEGVTPFMALLGAFQALLARYSGQDDVVVGSPIAGRNRPELEPLIGCFSNTLVLRTSLAGNPSFCELLGRVRETALGAFAHQDVPSFEKLVEELRPPRSANRTPLFGVNFRLLTAPLPPLKLSGLDLTFLEVDNRMAKFDLALELCARPEGLGGYLEYFADLFDPATARRMCGDYEELLGEIVARPDAPLSALTRRLGQAPGEPAAPRSVRAVRRRAVGLSPAANGAAPPAAGKERDRPVYTLRKATLRDAAFLYRLRSITLKAYVEQFPGWSDVQREAYYLDFDPAIHDIILVDGREAGAVSVVRSPNETRFINLHLLPEYQSQGIGTAVFQEAIAEATARGVPVVLQGVLKTNPAVKLYERLGFVITEETDLRYVMTRPCPAASGAPPAAPKGLRGIRRRGVQLPPE